MEKTVWKAIAGRAREPPGYSGCLVSVPCSCPGCGETHLYSVPVHLLPLCTKAYFLKIWSGSLVGLNLPFFKKKKTPQIMFYTFSFKNQCSKGKEPEQQKMLKSHCEII